MWKVVFTLDALQAIQYMSGLVTVEKVVFEGDIIYFYVTRTDKTLTIFGSDGFLKGTPVDYYPEAGQNIMVTSTLHTSFPLLSTVC